MDSKTIRDKFIKFFVERGHKEIAPAKLVPENDPTTLFTSSGMQPLIPYLLSQEHPEGKRLVDSQPSFRAEDIEEVGDNRHTTFFEMLGNWSLGDYWKKEQLTWIWEFLTEELSLPKEKLYVSVFEGDNLVPKDDESYEIWKSLGVEDDHIFFYGVDKNWWSRSGTPDKMPEREIGGPDSEVFYEFTSIEHDKQSLRPDGLKKYGDKCHPNCDCGRFLEIGNSVFIQYQKQKDGSLKELAQKNVDFGGGLERLTAVTLDTPDVFKTDLFKPIVLKIINQYFQGIIDEKTIFDADFFPTAEAIYGSPEEQLEDKKKVTESVRIIADHIRAAAFLISNGVLPSNKLQGYVLRRLLRKAAVKLKPLLLVTDENTLATSLRKISESVVESYEDIYFGADVDKERIGVIIFEEINQFGRSLENRSVISALDELEELQKALMFIHKNNFVKNLSLLFTKDGTINTYVSENQKKLLDALIAKGKNKFSEGEIIDEESKEVLEKFKKDPVALSSKWAFRFSSSYGVPIEILDEMAKDKNLGIDTEDLDRLKEEHQELSRTSSSGMFKGGLADHSEVVTKYHTTTHLLHQALRDVLGPEVFQKGSNITSERLRFDFSYDKKMTDEEIKKVEDIINQRIKEDLMVDHKIVSLDEAKKMNAIGLFNEKYADKVSIYGVGPGFPLDPGAKDQRDRGGYYSLEFCGGPHVEHTGVTGRIKITKEEAISAGIRRIRATLI